MGAIEGISGVFHLGSVIHDRLYKTVSSESSKLVSMHARRVRSSGRFVWAPILPNSAEGGSGRSITGLALKSGNFASVLRRLPFEWGLQVRVCVNRRGPWLISDPIARQ